MRAVHNDELRHGTDGAAPRPADLRRDRVSRPTASPSFGRFFARGALFAALLGVPVATLALGPEAHAQGKGGKKGKEPPAPPGPAQSKRAVTVSPAALVWGSPHKTIGEIYDKVYDEEFKPKYRKVSPGPAMTALDAELAELKAQVRRSLIRFGDVPTGFDSSPLRGEFTYRNKESVMSVAHKGRDRHFFFIQDKLWKVVDELQLGEGKPWGADFDSAVAKLSSYYGVTGRVREPDDKNGLLAKEADWTDGKTHVRAVLRHDAAFALIFEDEATIARLPSLRTNKPAETGNLDPSVADVIRKPSAPPGPPPDEGKKDGKKGKGGK